MGFLDKAKQQATQLAQKAQEGVKTGQAKLDQAQTKKKEDALLRDLGAVFYAEKTGKATGETAAEIERLLSELRTHEAEVGSVSTAPTAHTVDTGGAAGATQGAPEGDFKLDDL
jgi:hypothetical protein